MFKKTIVWNGLMLLSAALLVLPLVTQAAPAAGDDAPAIQVGAPFCDNAVLQRDMAVPVWGWSKPGTKVTVAFAGQKETGTAGEDGKWLVTLDKLEAGFKPAAMTISEDTGRTVVIENILVGEVWMVSGQSNMQWKRAKSTAAKLGVEPVGDDGIAPIREFEVTSVYSQLHPIERATGGWKNGDYNDYSAIAFAFAHTLYNELNVPIGILNCSFSTTKIQAWVPRVGFRDGKDDYTKAIDRQILKTDPATPEHKAAWRAFYKNIETALQAGEAISTDTPGNLNGNRDASWLFNGRLNPVVPYAMRGGLWNQGWASQGEGLKYYNNLHSMVRGWRLSWGRSDLPVYFHQFYSNGVSDKPAIGGSADMRLGTWLAARDIPGANMVCQIDIGGAIHYRHKTEPARRFARLAFKNQYGRDVVANGPAYDAYEVKGDKLIIAFDHAADGLVVASTAYNAIKRHDDSSGFADPKVIENGEDKVELFYVADADRVWHPADIKIDGNKVIVSSPGVKEPHGVSYATGGVGFQPNLYNRALLPMVPFIVYDRKLVTRENWPDEKLKVAGETIDPSSVGKSYEYRKMPVLSAQFRDNAVLQADQPVTIWGSAVHPWVHHGAEDMRPEGDAVVHFSFNGIEKDIPVTDDMMEWRVTVPPMKASAEPRTLKATFTIDGELVHERVATNVVIGDVWYVAAPNMKMDLPEVKPSDPVVRMMRRQAKRDSSSRPSRYSVCVSTTPKNRFASYWKQPSGLAAVLGHRIAAKTGRPVGVIYMQTRGDDTPLKEWIPPAYLKAAPSLMADHKQLASLRPGNAYYAANARRYMDAWKEYWGEYIPEMIATRAVPDDTKWGRYPSFAADVTTKASHVYNAMAYAFTPAALKGIVFIAGPGAVSETQGAHFGEQIAALATGWRERFALWSTPEKGVETPHFIYTVPGEALAPKITQPETIGGKSNAVKVDKWSEVDGVIEAVVDTHR